MNKTKRFATLLEMALGLQDPKSNASRLEAALPLVESSSAVEVMLLVDAIVERLPSMEEVKPVVSRLLNVFSEFLLAQEYDVPADNDYLQNLLAENRSLERILEALKPLVTSLNQNPHATDLWEELVGYLVDIEMLLPHYRDKENVLFPLVENHVEHSKCLQLMWSIHDDIFRNLKALLALAQGGERDLQVFNQLIGALFFDISSMIFREERVLLPALIELLPEALLAQLDEEQFGEIQVDLTQLEGPIGERIDLGTGNPTAAQLVQIFNHLPVDLTLLDRDDRVVYFNTPAERFFQRTKAVVGRTVQNCHPPESLASVENILTAFRKQEQSTAEFRLHLKGRYLLITYIALYDAKGDYDGTLEITQDITRLQTLRGEKRLLEWE